MTLPSSRTKALTLLYKTYKMMIKILKSPEEEITGESPFLSLNENLQKKDQVYQQMMKNKTKFAKDLIELILQDCCVKQDRSIITEEDGNKYLQTTVRKGKQKRTVTRIISDNVARQFKIFYNFFRFYGVEIFKIFNPVIKEYVDQGFEEKEHQNIWKVIIFDILSSFLKTSEDYYDQDPELYNETFDMMYTLYDPKINSNLRVFY